MKRYLFFILITTGIVFSNSSFSNNALFNNQKNASVKDTTKKQFTIGVGFTGAFLMIRGGYALIPHLDMRYKQFRILSGPTITPYYSVNPSFSRPDHGLFMSGYAVQCDYFLSKNKNPWFVHSVFMTNYFNDSDENWDGDGQNLKSSMRAYSGGIGLGKQFISTDRLSFFASLSFMYGVCHDTFDFDPADPRGTIRTNPDYYFGQAVAGFSYKIR